MKALKKESSNQIKKEKSVIQEENTLNFLDKSQLLKFLIAYKKGDFSVRMPFDLTGIDGKIADALNDIIEINEDIVKDINNITLVVGREGKLAERITKTGVTGAWKSTIDSINKIIADLVQPITEIGQVIGAIAKGNLSIKMSKEIDGKPLKGIILRTVKDVNAMVDQLSVFAQEVTRVAQEVSTEGKLGGQAKIDGVAGTWKELTDSVNMMALNITSQVRAIAEVTTAVANGDLSKKVIIEVKGEILELSNTINIMVDQLNSFAAEVTRVSKEVGTEGKLGGQAKVVGIAGIWKDLTDNVNTMANNLTNQVRSIADVTTAVARGDLSKLITVEAKGEILELRNTINTMVEQLNSFASEVTRVAKDVGTEGKLGGVAKVEGVTGIWSELTDSVNAMASNLTEQVRNIAEVTTAVANGDLTKKITVEVKGEVLELSNTINTMVEQLGSFAAEVTRVAREVGTEGKLGGQAKVEGVSGTWRELTDNVNQMASNLTAQVRNIATVTTAVAKGDLTKQITVDAQGEILELRNTINIMVEQLGGFAAEVSRVALEVGTEGKLGGQAKVEGIAGTWRELTDNVNQMASNLTAQVRNIATVTTAVAKGDLTKQITVDAQGEILELRNTINTMVDQLVSFAIEVTRVAREVGTEGKLGGQAEVEGVTGTWRELTENVNLMASNLTEQVRNIATVTTGVAKGDLSKKITVEAKGEILELRETINVMVDQLSSFAAEVTRVAREVGTEGKLGGQAEVKGVAGIWKNLTDNVNIMASNLTEQVRNIADVTTAVANGDLTKKITVEAKGEILELRNTINIMVNQLSSFADEVTRVAREVGTEGQLGGQAKVEGVAGIWKDLTDNVNMMARNLTEQVRAIAEVTTAVARGDLSKEITVEAKGEILRLRNTINKMVEQLNAFASEVTRVARDVGTLGKLGGQAEVKGVSGIWSELTGNVNTMANNLTEQVRSIADVTTAVASGDLTKKIDVEAKGEILKLRNTINNMVDQLSSFADEVTRVAREVGTEGELGGQAKVEGVSGTWRELTDNVNMMARNLTNQVRNIADVTTAVANGDLSKQITVEAKGEILQLKSTINTMVEKLSDFASEVTRVAQDVGTEGKLGGQAEVRGVAGIWKELTDNVNAMASNLTEQVRNIADVTTAVANGDLSRQITVEAKGEIQKLKDIINRMVDRLSTFASEVTRVAQEVGSEGQLGGQASVKGVAGVWKDLTDNVNMMANNLTDQVRSIANVVTFIANGDLTKKLEVAAKGEIAELADTINSMIETLSTFAQQVTTVAREVGIDGNLGAQAEVPGTTGTWRELTDNVNELANNLTTQVRAIGDVATAVIKGDLTQSIEVEARGEVALLRDNLNQMIFTLKSTTQKNEEQNWLSSNIARFTGMLQGQRDIIKVANLIMSELAPLINSQHGAFYIMDNDNSKTKELKLCASYAYSERKKLSNSYQLGDGLVGQCALEKKTILLTDAPEDYIKISSGLGEARPINIVVLPILFDENVIAVIELGSFKKFSTNHLTFLEQLCENIGVVINSITISKQTEELLKQSQSMGEELQNQQEELQQTNEELEEKAKMLEEQNIEVAAKNSEVEKAKVELQEKADQLSLTSKYKSEFLANMSHELRTPLNSLLILSKMLSDNQAGNLTPKQIEFAETIHASGADLLNLINEILDLSKIESGTMALEISQHNLKELEETLRRNFEEIAKKKQIDFIINLDSKLPSNIQTDSKRLQQVLFNILSNSFKFTEKGKITTEITIAKKGWNSENEYLNNAENVIAFSISDTGIGIPKDKQKIIFEAFQQVEGSISRKYAGTGLGLAISREIANMFGGEIKLISETGKGSTFIFYIPQPFVSIKKIHHDKIRNKEAAKPDSNVEFIKKKVLSNELVDDRKNIKPEDSVLLIIEDDNKFLKIIVKMAHEKKFKVLIANTGEAGLNLAKQFNPDAITLDINLPDMTGWTILDRIKHDISMRHIPVHIISVEAQLQKGLKMGAIACLSKPVNENDLLNALNEMKDFIELKTKKLLVIEDDEIQRKSIIELIGNVDVEITTVANGMDALQILKSKHFHCLVLDLNLPDISGFDLIDKIKTDLKLYSLPIIVYTGKELTKEEETFLKKAAETIIIKGVKSAERLLDETALFLHRVEKKLPDEKRKIIKQIHNTDSILEGCKVLIVDDDIRNIFALTSLLEQSNMKTEYAETGKTAIELLHKTKDFDIILMDIMMPEMDGYETMKIIRKMKNFESKPIIALTAKAMKGDREKCIEAGASDYITKPVNTDQLLSLLRVWLYK